MDAKELEEELKSVSIKWRENDQVWSVSRQLGSHKPAGSPVWRNSSISTHDYSLIKAIVDLNKAEKEDR